jgi:parallel beta-helix repeat protein
MIAANIIGVLINSSSANIFSGNTITANAFHGIKLESSSNYNSIYGNTITNQYFYGIWLDSSSGNSISGNIITNNTCGIELSGSLDNTISGNTITINKRNGILVDYSSGNSISGNSITNSVEEGICLDHSSNYNSIYGNTITTSNYNGIWLFRSSNYNNIYGNIITNNGAGIRLQSSSNYNSISENIVTNNYFGIRLYFSSNSSIYHNNFVNNTQQVDLRDSPPSKWDEGYPSGGNYWSDYDGTDLYCGPYQNIIGSDGIGDAPYIIDSNNRDNYPLMKSHPWASHDVGITNVECSRNTTGGGYNATMNLMLFNYGNSSESFNVRIYANETLIGESSSIELASRNFTTLSFVWNTSIIAKGNYTIKAVADPVLGEIDLSDNNLTDGWVLITKVGDIGGEVPPTFFNCDSSVDGKDLALFLQCYKGTAPAEAMYLADLGSGVPPKFYNCDGKVDGKDLALFLLCFKGLGP